MGDQNKSSNSENFGRLEDSVTLRDKKILVANICAIVVAFTIFFRNGNTILDTASLIDRFTAVSVVATLIPFIVKGSFEFLKVADEQFLGDVKTSATVRFIGDLAKTTYDSRTYIILNYVLIAFNIILIITHK